MNKEKRTVIQQRVAHQVQKKVVYSKVIMNNRIK